LNKTKSNIGSRILAGVIDYGIIYTFFFVLIFTLGEPDVEGIYHLKGLSAIIPITFWFALTVGLEFGMGGTIGNSLMGLKVISIKENNRNITFTQSLKRHLLDPIDMFFFGLVGAITIEYTERNQRVGDLWAKTIVVRKNKM